MRVLVTGIAGFAGSHLAEALVRSDDEVVGVSREERLPAALAGLGGQVRLVSLDLSDAERTREVVAEVQPEVIYHLAASASPAQSLRDPGGTLANNVLSTVAVLEAARLASPRPRVLLVTSSDVYGAPPAHASPLAEDAPLSPLNPYAVSKVTTHFLGRQAWLAHRLEVVEARPFNHIGPRQQRGFVVPDFASQVAAIALGRQEPVLRVGDLSAERDFTDVRDIVRGYRDLALDGEPGATYHLCQGEPTRIETLLSTLIDLAGVEVRVEVDPDRLRPGPRSAVWGSYERAYERVLWSPTLPLRDALAEVLAEWRERAHG